MFDHVYFISNIGIICVLQYSISHFPRAIKSFGKVFQIGSLQMTRPSILCVTQKRTFMPLYIVLGQQRACMPVYIGKSGDLVG